MEAETEREKLLEKKKHLRSAIEQIETRCVNIELAKRRIARNIERIRNVVSVEVWSAYSSLSYLLNERVNELRDKKFRREGELYAVRVALGETIAHGTEDWSDSDMW